MSERPNHNPTRWRTLLLMIGGYAYVNVVYIVLCHWLDPGSSNPRYAQVDGWQFGAVIAPALSGILTVALAAVRVLRLSIGQWLAWVAALLAFGLFNLALSLFVGAMGA
jgi:hypothetical protein